MARSHRIVAAALSSAALLVAAAPAASAQFVPGDLYVSSWKKLIYKVDPNTWTVTTFADLNDGIDGVSGLAWHPNDELLVASYYNDKVFSFDSAGVATTKWSAVDGLNGPFGQNALHVTVGGIVYVSNWDNQALLEIQPSLAPTVFCDIADGIAHVDGVVSSAFKQLYLANRDGKNVLRVTIGGVATVFDTLPDQAMSIAMHPNGSIYVACLYGDIYRYTNHNAATRTLWVSNNRRLATPVLRFNHDYSKLYFTSSGKGNLIEIDPLTAAQAEVLPVGSLGIPLGMEFVGGHDDIGIYDYAYNARVPGTGDVLPSLNGSGHPVFGFTFTLELRDFVGNGLVHLITAERERQEVLGHGTLYTDISGHFTITDIQLPGTPGLAGDGDLDYSDVIGTDPAIDGNEWWLQAYCDDPTPNNSGTSLSNPIKIVTRSY
ncbi:MAG: hypothetical protein EXR73_04855 [Myxococcales bacterium]|nr:hypothetical protein [Myxococcales bacterium]